MRNRKLQWQQILLLLLNFSWIVLIWVIGLPRLAEAPSVRSHISKMESANVNVDAMFYTELSWYPGR